VVRRWPAWAAGLLLLGGGALNDPAWRPAWAMTPFAPAGPARLGCCPGAGHQAVITAGPARWRPAVALFLDGVAAGQAGAPCLP
jgi:hypothetical protein